MMKSNGPAPALTPMHLVYSTHHRVLLCVQSGAGTPPRQVMTSSYETMLMLFPTIPQGLTLVKDPYQASSYHSRLCLLPSLYKTIQRVILGVINRNLGWWDADFWVEVVAKSYMCIGEQVIGPGRKVELSRWLLLESFSTAPLCVCIYEKENFVTKKQQR